MIDPEVEELFNKMVETVPHLKEQIEFGKKYNREKSKESMNRHPIKWKRRWQRYYKKNKEKMLANTKKWAKNNKEYLREYRRKRYQKMKLEHPRKLKRINREKSKRRTQRLHEQNNDRKVGRPRIHNRNS
jgi:dTDP-D-glucose 4,6-dehydratase